MIGKLRAKCFNQLLKFNRDGLLVKNSKNSNKAAPDLSSLLQMAISMHNNNKLEDAAKLYEYVLSIDPRNFNALHMLGEVSFRNGDFRGAGELRVPTLIACGREDAWSPVSQHEAMQRLAPRASDSSSRDTLSISTFNCQKM